VPEPESVQLQTIREVAGRLRISQRLVRSLVATGELPVVRIRRRILVSPEALVRFVRAREIGAADLAEDAPAVTPTRAR
jgi:excisionase family DNA binding protein